MTDFLTRLANRRCPDCHCVQPLYLSAGKGPGFLRGGSDVAACPGCGVPLRILASPRDPHGILAASIMVIVGTGSIMGTVFLAAEQGWPAGLVGTVIVALVGLMVVSGFGWTVWKARGRAVVHATTQETSASETRT